MAVLRRGHFAAAGNIATATNVDFRTGEMFAHRHVDIATAG
jgi:hypothetical protein